jgi:hypothetical protein
MKKLLFILALACACFSLPLALESDHLEFIGWGIFGTIFFGMLCASWDEIGR